MRSSGSRDGPAPCYHLTASDRATTLGELVELASWYFDRPRPRMVSPALYRRVHPLLVWRSSEARRRALQRTEVFFPYFDAHVRYDNAHTLSALRPLGIEPPPIDSYFERLMAFADEATGAGGRCPEPGAASSGSGAA